MAQPVHPFPEIGRSNLQPTEVLADFHEFGRQIVAVTSQASESSGPSLIFIRTLLDAKGDPTGITVAYRDAIGNLIRAGKAKQRDLNDFPASS
jgi:hypothetical protein